MSYRIAHSFFQRLNRFDNYNDALRFAMHRIFLQGSIRRRVSDDDILSAVLGAPCHFLNNTAFKLGPVALSVTLTTNIFNPGTTTAGTACTSAPFDKLYTIFRRFGIVNKHASIAAKASLWIGLTGANTAGTEFMWSATAVAVGAYDSRPCYKRFGVTDFLVGGSDTATALTLDADGEIGVGA